MFVFGVNFENLFSFLALLCPISEDCHIISQFSFHARHVRVEVGRWTRPSLFELETNQSKIAGGHDNGARLLGASKFEEQVNWKDFSSCCLAFS